MGRCKILVFHVSVLAVVFVAVRSECVIRPKSDTDKQSFADLIALDTTELLRIDFKIAENNRPDFATWKTYLPDEWTIVTKDSGQYVLTSPPDTEIFSLGIFSFIIKSFDMPIESEPELCLRNMTESQFKTSILNLIFSCMESSKNLTESRLPDDDEICYEKAIVSGGHVHFKHQCCAQPGNCKEVSADWWQDFLYYLIFALKIIVFLYAANLVPEYLYKDKYGHLIFYCKLDENPTFRVADRSADTTEIVAELETGNPFKPASMNSLRDAVKGHSYSIKGIWFKVWENRLVSKAYLPIGLFIFLYQRLVQCTCYTYRGHATPSLKLRQLTTMRDYADYKTFLDIAQRDFSVRICCELPICNPQHRFVENRLPKWHTVLHVFMTICSTFIFAIPWLVIHLMDEQTLEAKRGRFAHDRNMIYTPPFHAFDLLRFINITLSGLFLAIMVIYVICVTVVAVILKNDKEDMIYVGNEFRSTLRNAKSRWEDGVMKSSRFLVSLFLPFKLLRDYGLIALLLWPFWIAIVFPLSILLALLGNAPTVNIFFRLFLQFIKEIWKVFHSGLIRTDVKKSVRRIVVSISLIVILFILLFFVFALVSLLVNIIAYTFIAVVVTAQQTVRYTAFAVLIILNARDCISAAKQRYTVFNEKLQATILAQTRDEVKKIAKRKKCDQTNTAFKIKVESEDEAECFYPGLWHDMAISEKHKILWNARSVIQFLDNDDKVYLSEKFFFDACYMDYYGCPGDFASSLYLAVRQVFLITAFLAFVVFTLNAYGGLEANTSSGLLVTLASGLLPLFVRRFFAKPIPELSLDTEEFHFQNSLDNLICDFSEYWEVVDLDIEKTETQAEKTAKPDTEAKFWLKVGPHDSVQLAVSCIEEQYITETQDTVDTLSMDFEMEVVDPTQALHTNDGQGIVFELYLIPVSGLIIGISHFSATDKKGQQGQFR